MRPTCWTVHERLSLYCKNFLSFSRWFIQQINTHVFVTAAHMYRCIGERNRSNSTQTESERKKESTALFTRFVVDFTDNLVWIYNSISILTIDGAVHRKEHSQWNSCDENVVPMGKQFDFNQFLRFLVKCLLDLAILPIFSDFRSEECITTLVETIKWLPREFLWFVINVSQRFRLC